MNDVVRLRAIISAVALAVLPFANALATDSANDPTPRSFYADRRAMQTGDVFTVIVTEFSTVTATARTQTAKDESAQATLLDATGQNQIAAAGIGSKFAGGGQIERSGRLVAKLAVTVSGVDPRGNLIIHGEQEIHINNERQRIRLDGIVRPEDIEPDNTIASARVGNARIELTGKGLLARKQGPGLLTRILSWFWE